MNKVQDIISNTLDYFILTSIPDHFLNLGQIINVHFILMNIYAESFCGFKMILDRPNHFGRVPFVLNNSN